MAAAAGTTGLPPPIKNAPGWSTTDLDIYARRYLETEKDVFPSSDPLHVFRNESVAVRARQMEVAINHILDSPMSPGEKLTRIKRIDPGLAAAAQSVAYYGEPMGRTGGSNRYNQLLNQIVPRIRPDYQQQGYAAEQTRVQKLSTDYSAGGYAGKTLLLANNLARDAANVIKTARELPDDPSTPLGRAFEQWMAGTFTGDARYTNFFAAWSAYAQAQVRVQRGGSGAEADIQRTVANVRPAASKEQIFGALKADTDDAVAQIDGLDYYWHAQGMREPMRGLNPNAMQIFDAIQHRMNPFTGEISDEPESLRGGFREGFPRPPPKTRRAPLIDFGTDPPVRVKP
jgi:hypothetical protein